MFCLFDLDWSTIILILINFKSKVNAICQKFAELLCLWIQLTNINVNNVDNTILEMFGIVIATFDRENKE